MNKEFVKTAIIDLTVGSMFTAAALGLTAEPLKPAEGREPHTHPDMDAGRAQGSYGSIVAYSTASVETTVLNQFLESAQPATLGGIVLEL